MLSLNNMLKPDVLTDVIYTLINLRWRRSSWWYPASFGSVLLDLPSSTGVQLPMSVQGLFMLQQTMDTDDHISVDSDTESEDITHHRSIQPLILAGVRCVVFAIGNPVVWETKFDFTNVYHDIACDAIMIFSMVCSTISSVTAFD